MSEKNIIELENRDGEWFIKKKVKVFFQDDIIPVELIHNIKYDLVILPWNRKNKEVKENV